MGKIESSFIAFNTIELGGRKKGKIYLVGTKFCFFGIWVLWILYFRMGSEIEKWLGKFRERH
jgi:hypothetical protein